MNRKFKLLIVEDEKRLADIIRMGLQEHGYSADVAYDGFTGKELVMQGKYDLILLDINVPIINGYELCREIRSVNKSIPIIIITALSSPNNKLFGFDNGADDYITKPFDFPELLARIKVFLRRSSTSDPDEEDIQKIDDLVINFSNKTVIRNNILINLTAKEYALIEFFVKNKGKLLSRVEIAEAIWGLDFDTGTNYIDVYINYLRKKIDKDHSNKLIHTRIGMGYIFQDHRQRE